MTQRIRSNAEQFASMGEEWGALPDRAQRRSYKRRQHPDGFVEYTVVSDEDESQCPGPNPHVKPNPFVPKRPKPKNYDSKRRMAALLIERKAPVRDPEDRPRPASHVFVPARPQAQVQDQAQRDAAESRARLNAMAERRRRMLLDLYGVRSFTFTDKLRKEVDALFGSWFNFEAQAQSHRS